MNLMRIIHMRLIQRLLGEGVEAIKNNPHGHRCPKTLNDGSSAKNVLGCCWNHLNLDISGPIHWSFNIFEGAEHAMMLFLKGSIKVLEGPTKAACGNGGFRVLEQQSIDKEHRQLMVIFRWIPHLEC